MPLYFLIVYFITSAFISSSSPAPYESCFTGSRRYTPPIYFLMPHAKKNGDADADAHDEISPEMMILSAAIFHALSLQR